MWLSLELKVNLRLSCIKWNLEFERGIQKDGYLTKPEGGDSDMLQKRFEFTDRPSNMQMQSFEALPNKHYKLKLDCWTNNMCLNDRCFELFNSY